MSPCRLGHRPSFVIVPRAFRAAAGRPLLGSLEAEHGPLRVGMGDWKGYISAVLRDQRIDDVAIVGHSDNRCVWASRPGGLLAAISPQEVGVLTGHDRRTFLLAGLSLAGRRCCVIRDHLLAEGDCVLDARTKGQDGRSVCVGRTPRALLVLMGRRGVHGGVLNKTVHELIRGLRMQGT
ncbi:LOW QUALITY PROTEIN: profilin-3 [Dasypus novemcinctus]|uniref:LOW QUALITY PROTEIN: profilin-3 n=1 Tax=Dasypus novemcinctus TaxID=9361 RepID=UPI00265E0838|nr:LOW QUALITY PROTEIN: profilin-3 [Dasypus novemcinctus]